ncbi:hypothetical protein AB1Y20_000588 [Prymnesium parvum]|uniref:ShKT domain-containing protein n=1 Tax=Prymnesium parvum TaxID=97485 RepID=A0AB34K8J1_PRYPA
MLAAHAFLAASIGPRRSLQFASLVPPNDACVDTHEMCAQWAAAGECENNPSFMLTGCADSCTKCKEGPSGVGQLRTPAERNRRKDRWCGNLDDDCERRAEAGACHNGSDAPLRCPGSCRACGFKSILEEAEEANAFIEGCAEHFDRSLAGDQLSPVRTSTQCWCSGNKCGSSAITQAVAHRIANITQVQRSRERPELLTFRNDVVPHSPAL